MLRDKLDIERLVTMTEQPMIEACSVASRGSARRLVARWHFRPTTRWLYKRLAQYSYFEEPDMYRRMARRPYAELVDYRRANRRRIVEAALARKSRRTKCWSMLRRPSWKSISISRSIFAKQNVYRRLGDISPVVRTLAQEQFDDYVKRVRIFVHPRIAAAAASYPTSPNDWPHDQRELDNVAAGGGRG